MSASKSPFAVRDFRLLWFGEAISALGDQFAMIALPWLALLLTGSALALGTVLALMAVPRAVLMLIGGVYVDRLSPRRVMILSNAVRLVAVAILGGVVIAGVVELWMLYVFGLVFGVADAFFYPAQSAMVPELVSSEQLQRANGITQGTTQLTVLVGPALAGIVIAVLGGGNASASVAGTGLALILDGVSFVASLVMLLLIARRPVHGEHTNSVVSQIVEGIHFVWRWPALRLVMILSMAANLLIVGPFEVGFPVLAYSRLPEGAVAFGMIVSAFGGGSLIGMALATLAPKVPARHFGTTVLSIVSISGFALAAIAFAGSSSLVVIALTGSIGISLGYTNLLFITWVQRRVPRTLMGRVMSLMMFSSLALVPVSMAVAGAVVQLSLDGLLIVAGLGMAALALVALVSGAIRRMGLEPEINEETGTESSEPSAVLAA